MTTLFSTRYYLVGLLVSFLIVLPQYVPQQKTVRQLPSFTKSSKLLFHQMQLEKLGLKEDIFNMALIGWHSLKKEKLLATSNLLTIVDLSQSSNNKRLYILDIHQKKVLFHTYVAHGRNSGGEFAISFANKRNSFKSSLGFYITGATYCGEHGLSLRLKGMEKGINDGAEERGIVLHGAPYVSEAFIKECGRLGRSEGCPAVPEALCTPIIHEIKEGSCLFIYYPDKSYLQHSLLIR